MHNDQLTATSILALLDTTRAQRRTFAEQVITAIEEGQVNPLLVHCQIKATQSLIDQFTEKGDLKDRYFKALLPEAEKYGKIFEYHGSKFEVKEAGTKYDYSQCGDPEMDKLLAEMEVLKSKIKDRETFLKGIKGHLDIVDQETGEVVTLYPPAKTSTTTVAVTLK